MVNTVSHMSGVDILYRQTYCTCFGWVHCMVDVVLHMFRIDMLKDQYHFEHVSGRYIVCTPCVARVLGSVYYVGNIILRMPRVGILYRRFHVVYRPVQGAKHSEMQKHVSIATRERTLFSVELCAMHGAINLRSLPHILGSEKTRAGCCPRDTVVLPMLSVYRRRRARVCTGVDLERSLRLLSDSFAP